jgi:hypothetical protein
MQLFINHTIRYEDVLCSSEGRAVQFCQNAQFHTLPILSAFQLHIIYTTIALELRVHVSVRNRENSSSDNFIKPYLS